MAVRFVQAVGAGKIWRWGDYEIRDVLADDRYWTRNGYDLDYRYNLWLGNSGSSFPIEISNNRKVLEQFAFEHAAQVQS